MTARAGSGGLSLLPCVFDLRVVGDGAVRVGVGSSTAVIACAPIDAILFGFLVIRGFGQHVEHQIHDERADGTADKQREHVPRPTGQIIQFAEQAPGVFHYRYPPRKNPEIVCFWIDTIIANYEAVVIKKGKKMPVPKRTGCEGQSFFLPKEKNFFFSPALAAARAAGGSCVFVGTGRATV